MEFKSLSLSTFVEFIEKVPGFSFARISDGGFFCLQGKQGKNCDGVVYTQAQADALRAVMLDDSITHGITRIAIFAANAEQWLKDNGIEVDWYDADVMNKAADEGKLYPFIQCLEKRKIVYCGPKHLKRLQGFPIAGFVTCHPTAAFEEVDRLENELSVQIDKHRANTVLLSAGQGASPTLVSRLHRDRPEIVVIDVGSIFDPYVGVFSRSGHKRAGVKGIQELGRQNFKQETSSWWS
jgi:hypothetical protein